MAIWVRVNQHPLWVRPLMWPKNVRYELRDHDLV
jgi:hypothetical protein